ncbi:cytoskeletal protein CcmA (bactofilin family) [Desulfohalotomaculum tongense]|uniref:bactofilin family protein n=1 Tax=Desulforadius tongensis TaxID=1216062 RepID=UPI00195B301A|nr:polymer-forming cytoskeletal protein [Desulforadius tongensis]MBM7854390.1 cytoskeletal protein CcmA (bactofilin family) [Desulforadius tongensis]
MFGKKSDSINHSKVDTVIGDGTYINGDIKVDGVLRIDGKVDGHVDINGDVIIGPTGYVNADINGNNVTVAGEVHGNITLKGKLELDSTAKLYGDIEVSKLVINEGAIFKGKSSMIGSCENENEIS